MVAAFVAMQIYLKRGIQGRLKATADEIGDQYAPKNMTTNITNSLDATQTIESSYVPLTDSKGQEMRDTYGLPMYGIKTKVTIDDEKIARSGNESAGEFEKTLFQ